ncbi:lysophospholipid acyltransferase family protein [Ferruginibacter albus]|uniref:lysophospholipid acyltransferase family protein n=1 Tax=Ferruginibacter albus TaxID=2875540 RepID=UPI001CC71DA2|nr:lysophospholipid acyltransferase family protein [Ferruginibacter albus]UAY52948.1 1-acyl-sn-glycerol-3-phosphate acyltransferase [Ferruginibacter albus]
MRYFNLYIRYLVRAVSCLFSIYALATFIIGVIIVFPFALIFSFLGKDRGGNIIYVIGRGWTDLSFLLWGIWHKNIYEASHDRKRQYVFVVNHISYMDIPAIMKTVRRQRLRVLGKVEPSKIPIFGSIYKDAVVMVDRSTNESRINSIKELMSVIHNGTSILIFPEGTFNETHQPLIPFFDGAFRIAIETQTPVKPLLFLDTYKRLNYRSFFSLMPGRCRAVYLEEVPVEGLTLNDLPMLKEKVYRIMQEKLISYKAEWIKQDDRKRDTTIQ